jgi:hypothetical protein
MDKKIMFCLIALFIGVSSFAQEQKPKSAKKAVEARSNLVVVIVAEGGLCNYGTCHIETEVFTNGSYVSLKGPDKKSKGQLDKQEFEDLKVSISQTDFTKIRQGAFRGTCPTAYDGQKYHYYFYVRGKVEEVDSCEHQIDYSLPLFKTLGAILVKAS